MLPYLRIGRFRAILDTETNGEMLIQRLRVLRHGSCAASRVWIRRNTNSLATEPPALSIPSRRRRSRSKWRRIAAASAAAFLLGWSSTDPSPGPMARRNWLLLRSGLMLSGAFADYTEFKRDLFGGDDAEMDARETRRLQWWDAIQRTRLEASDAQALSLQDRMVSVAVNLVLGAVDGSEAVLTTEERRALVQLLLARGLLDVLVEFIALEKPTDADLLERILKCLEIALDEANRLSTTEASEEEKNLVPSLSLVPLGVALKHLLEQETPGYGDLLRLGQSLLDFQRLGSNDLITRSASQLKSVQRIDDEFGEALSGYVELLSPEMPPRLKEFAMEAMTSLLREALKLPQSSRTRQFNAAVSPICATYLLSLPRANAHLQTSAAALMTNLLQVAQASTVPVSPDIYDLWIQQIRSWIGESSPSGLQLAGSSCLRVLSNHPRTRHYVRDSAESMEALFGLARQLHEEQVRPAQRQKKKKNRNGSSGVELPSLLDQLERTLIQKHISRTFLNVCTSYKSGETAILESMSSQASSFHSKRSLPMSSVFRGAQDFMDLPVVGAEEYDSSTEFGWADILTAWTGSSDRDIRRNAIQSLVHLVEQDSEAQGTREKQQHLLQAWLASMLQHVRNVKGGEEILAIKQVEDIARISDEFTPGNETILFNPAVVDAGCSALAVLAEQHYDELIHFGVVELVSLLAAKCPSDKVFDFPTQSARVVANLVAACSKTLECQEITNGVDSATTPSELVKTSMNASSSFSYSHPLWRSLLAEVFDVGQMLESSSSGQKLLAMFRTWSAREDPYERSQLYQALANMAAYRELANTGKRTLPTYAEGVHPIAPEGAAVNEAEDADVDVVFVHGLRGDAFGTWRTDMGDSIDARTDVWPDILLHQDLKNLGIRARVVSLGYEAGMVSWSSPWPSLTLQERANLMLKALYAANIGQQQGASSDKTRPVIFVTHSMGGLLVKKMLLQSKLQQQEDEAHAATSSLADATKGVVFLAVPHFGSDLARGVRSEAVRTLLRTHPAIQDLCASNDRRLESLNESFAELHIDCLSIAEQKPAPLGFGISAMVVKPDSANPGIGQFFILPDADHMTICKAKTNDDPMYQSVLNYVLEHITMPEGASGVGSQF